jgi:hypothetical protein
MKKVIVDAVAVLGFAAMVTVPAFAGQLGPTPVAGVGVGALAVLAYGYRALRNRIDG